MRILFEITHPKHFHLFHNAISMLSERGHEIAITVRKKDITTRLLETSGLSFTVLTRQNQAGGMLSLGWELLLRDWRLLRFARCFRPDIFVGRVGPCASHVGFFMRKPVLVFEDTEDGTLQQRISFPFATHVCTAMHYEKNWGKKHIRYKSFDELAYLHPNRFTPDPTIARANGLEPGTYIIVRFVSWRAAHDVGEKGIRIERRLDIVRKLECHGRVLITSEGTMPREFERFRLPVPPERFHHLLAFAKLTFGESSTVATEGAMLGVPGILVNTMNWGSINRLTKQYGMLFQTTSEDEALKIAEELLRDSATSEYWRHKRESLLQRESDLTEWMIDMIERFKT